MSATREKTEESPAERRLRAYAMLALRVDRRVIGSSGGTVLIYRGPQEWSAQVEADDPPPPGRLTDDADRLLAEVPFDPPRAAFLTAQVTAMRAVTRRLDGERLPLSEYARQCLGVTAEPVPESVFAEAHAELDAALPKGPGSLEQRLRAWRRMHTLRRMDRLPGLVDKAVAEARARTTALVPLPADEVVDCQVVPDAHFHAAGHYAGGGKSTIYINGGIPFNLADLLYVVTHEGHPGHIAESLIKETHLVDRQGRLEQRIRFMISPSFVLSEGLGLHAEAIAFPGDEAKSWLIDNVLRDNVLRDNVLRDNVLAEHDVRHDVGDLAAIHHAKNVLWGAWANAAFLAAEERPEAQVAGYLSRWALLDETEVSAARKVLTTPGMNVYILAYYHGWRLVRRWLDGPDRTGRLRRLLTEQLLPSDLEPDGLEPG